MSETFSVEFLPDRTIARVAKGTTVFEAARENGLMLSGYCGGNGTCGKCAVEVLSGAETGMHLACGLHVESNMRVRIPEDGEARILTGSAASADNDFISPLSCRFVLAAKRAIGDCRSEWELFLSALGVNAEAPLSLMSAVCGIGDSYALLCDKELLGIFPEKPAYYMVAYDIGTTSIVCYLLDGASGEQKAVSSMLNPQVSFGADVISRARHALEHGGSDLQAAVIGGMNRLLKEACDKAGVSTSAVYLISAAGNTCMHHLLLGLSPAPLVTAPYNAVLRQSLTLDAAALGIAVGEHAKLRVLPDIAGFVGADTVAGLIATDLAESDKLTLLIDIGTNGELVLGDSVHGRIACSTAAGPAFEGAMIHCGMRGADGAIDHVRIEDGELRFTVIGGGEAKGICGSGLVDLVAVLLDAGVIDEGGRLTDVAGFSERLQKVDALSAFFITDDVSLTQKDIRELQLAKAAMAAGIRLMCEELGVRIDDIQKIQIAGAFGNYLDAASACRIGLLPMQLLPCIEGIGNAAGEGAKRVLRDPVAWRSADALAYQTRFLELATRADFQDCFVDELTFPEVTL